MKERFVKVLHITRKFGFIMAAVMLFPHVVSLPAVMASDGSTSTEAHEVSTEELQEKYSALDAQLEKDERIIESLEQYIRITATGELLLEIPANTVVEVTDEELNNINNQIEFVNARINDGSLVANYDGNHVFIYETNTDDDFVVQANSNSFSVRWYGNRIRIDFDTMEEIYESIHGFINDIDNWKKGLTVTVLWKLITWSFKQKGAATAATYILNMLHTTLGVFILDVVAAITAVLTSVYFWIVIVVVVLSGLYNYNKIKTAGTSWTDGTEIRTYGVYAYIPASTTGILFPSYREQ